MMYDGYTMLQGLDDCDMRCYRYTNNGVNKTWYSKTIFGFIKEVQLTQKQLFSIVNEEDVKCSIADRVVP